MQCTLLIHKVPANLIPDRNIGIQIFGREPVARERQQLGLHMAAWQWLNLSNRTSAVVIEDSMILHDRSFPSPTCQAPGPLVTSLDNYELDSTFAAELLGVEAPPQRTGLVWPAEYILSSGAYVVCSAGARALLSQREVAGGVVDQLNHVLSQIPASMAYASPAPAGRAQDMDVLVLGGWLRSEQQGFRCRPLLGHSGRHRDVWFAAGNMGDFEHSSVRQVGAGGCRLLSSRLAVSSSCPCRVLVQSL